VDLDQFNKIEEMSDYIMKSKIVILLWLLVIVMVGIGIYIFQKKSADVKERKADQISTPTSKDNMVSVEGREALVSIETKKSKIDYGYSVEDSTGEANVRATTAKIGADYRVTERSALGVEAGRTMHDTRDAAAWKRSVEDENTAQIKYKLSF
jgi:hypothetical protein